MTNDKRQYWCKLETDELKSKLVGKITNLVRSYETSSLYSWQLTSWKYYNNVIGNGVDRGVKLGGKQGEYAVMGVNHYRSLLSNVKTLVTGSDVTFKSGAVNGDEKSKQKAKLAEDIINYYQNTKNLEERWNEIVEQAIVMGEGYLKVIWDPNIGEQYDAEDNVDIDDAVEEAQEPKEIDEAILDKQTGVEEEDNKIQEEIEEQEEEMSLYEGDVKFEVLPSNRVFYPRKYKDWDDVPWVITKTYVNKWDLIAQFPDKEDDILDAEEKDDVKKIEEDFNIDDFSDVEDEEEDIVPLWELYHKKTDAMPKGRYVMMVGGEIINDLELPYRRIPIFKMQAGEVLGTSYGYTSGFDMIAAQEVLNKVTSSMITAVKRDAVQNYWTDSTDTIKTSQIAGVGNHVRSRTRPELMEHTQISEHLYNMKTIMTQEMEVLSGINSTTRGQLEAKLSGTAYALLDSKSIQYQNNIIKNYYRMLEDSASFLVELLQQFSYTKRTIEILGEENRGLVERVFTSEELDGFKRFRLTSVNPIYATTGGKMEIADKLINNGFIERPEEYLDFLDTGRLKQMYDVTSKELSAVERENELILQGKGDTVQVEKYDRHDLHISKHRKLLSLEEVKTDEEKYKQVLAHMMTHVEIWEQISVFEPNIAQTLNIPLVAPSQVPGMEQQNPSPNVAQGQTASGEAMQRPMQQNPNVKVRDTGIAQPAKTPTQPIVPRASTP